MTTWTDEHLVRSPADLPPGCPPTPIYRLLDAVVDNTLTEVTALYEHGVGRYVIHIKNDAETRVFVKEVDL
jgi:hypothetical protein